MAKDKKYYWLKLKEDFFEEDTISWIEEQENGKEYCLFYLKLCLKSLKTNGMLVRNVGTMLVPYDAKQLAKITNTDIDTVRVAMELFTKIGLVEILENGEIYLTQLENMVGSETKWAEYKRKQKENSKLENVQYKLENVQDASNGSPKKVQTEIEQEIETETEIDIEKEIEIELEQQHIERKDVVDKVGMYLPYLNEKDINAIVNEFLKTNKDLYYLSEKLILTTDARNIENKVGYLLKAIKEDYQIRYVTSLSNLVTVWEQELLEKPNNPIIADKVKYYRFKCES